MSNYGTFRRRTGALPIMVGAIVVLSMLPVSWLGWTSDLADLIRVPVTPVSHVGMMLTNWVRPGVEPSDLPSDEKERNEHAIAERANFRQMYHAQMLRANELADQLRLLQDLPEDALRNPQPPIILHLDITGVNPSDVAGTVELKLVSGATNRIRRGDIAIVGKDIVGRIARIGLTRIELQSITHKDIGMIRAAVVRSGPSNDSSHMLAEILLRSEGDGYLYAEASASNNIQIGDLVVLNDPSWPATGRGWILGSVIKASPLDQAPLRQALVIAPRRRVQDVLKVVVLGTGGGQTQ